MDENQIRQALLLARLRKVPFHSRFRAVHLVHAGQWIGSGTLVADRRVIITCEHLFSPDRERAVLYYQELQPFTTILKPINRFNGSRSADVGECFPGPPVPIDYRSKHWTENGKGFTRADQVRMFRPAEPQTCASMATGEVVRVLGWLTGVDATILYVLEYDSCRGESGAGFVRNPTQLFVLTRSLLVEDDHRKYFSIQERFKWVSLAVAVDIH